MEEMLLKRFIKKALKFLLKLILSVSITLTCFYLIMVAVGDKIVFASQKTMSDFSILSDKINKNIDINTVSNYKNESIFIINEIENILNKESSSYRNKIEIYITNAVNEEVYTEIQSYFYLKYGFMYNDGMILFKKGNIVDFIVLEINIKEINQIKEKMVIVDEIINKMDNIEGQTDEEKLKNISDIVAGEIQYTEGYRDLYNALLNHKGVCNSYAMLMKKICEKNGYKCDLCFGYVDNIVKDSYHVWNRVTLSDGKYRYFDITGYDTTKDKSYLFMDESPFEILTVNKYFFERFDK